MNRARVVAILRRRRELTAEAAELDAELAAELGEAVASRADERVVAVREPTATDHERAARALRRAGVYAPRPR